MNHFFYNVFHFNLTYQIMQTSLNPVNETAPMMFACLSTLMLPDRIGIGDKSTINSDRTMADCRLRTVIACKNAILDIKLTSP